MYNFIIQKCYGDYIYINICVFLFLFVFIAIIIETPGFSYNNETLIIRLVDTIVYCLFLQVRD